MRFVIGDIHGEISKLRALLSNLQQYEIEELIFIGDYLDKGEDSKATLLFIRELSEKFDCTFLMGSHEYAWLQFIENGSHKDFLLAYGGLKTLRDFGLSSLDPKDVHEAIYLPFKDLFDSLKIFLILNEYVISHSGISLDILENEDWNLVDPGKFVFNRYDFIRHEGLIMDRVAIFGHTGFVYPYYDGWKIGIDTGAVYLKDAPLTAFELGDKFFIDSFNRKLMLEDIDTNTCPVIIRSKRGE